MLLQTVFFRAPIPANESTALKISKNKESLLQLVHQEQRQEDQKLEQLMDYLIDKALPDNIQAAKHVIGQSKIRLYSD